MQGPSICLSGRSIRAIQEAGRSMKQAGESWKAEEPVPEGFTVVLALEDAVPVVLFCLATIAAGQALGSPLFVAGACISFAAGTLKVSWKLAIAVAHRNIPVLSRQMRYVMPLGFLLMALGLIFQHEAAAALILRMFALPSLPFTLAWMALICFMVHFARTSDQLDSESNWKEQGTNSAAQLAFLVSVLLASM